MPNYAYQKSLEYNWLRKLSSKASASLSIKIAVLYAVIIVIQIPISAYIQVLIDSTGIFDYESSLEILARVSSGQLILYGLNIIGTIVTTFIPFVWFSKKFAGNPLDLFKYGRIKASDILNASALTLASIMITSILTSIILETVKVAVPVMEDPDMFAIPYDSFSATVLMVFMVSIVAPISEEFIFRGVLLKALQSYGDKFAIVTTALLFGMLHGNFTQMPYAFIAGLIFGYLTVKSGSIMSAVIVHMINNTFSLVLQFAGDKLEENHLISSGLSLIIILLTVYSVVFLVKNKYKLDLKEGKYRALSGKEKAKALFSNSGTIIYIVITAISCVFTFFFSGQ